MRYPIRDSDEATLFQQKKTLPCGDSTDQRQINMMISAKDWDNHKPFLDRAPNSQFVRPFGGSVRGFRQRAANWGSVVVHRFSASEGTLISTSPAI